jgi:hypothetical protein
VVAEETLEGLDAGLGNQIDEPDLRRIPGHANRQLVARRRAAPHRRVPSADPLGGALRVADTAR